MAIRTEHLEKDSVIAAKIKYFLSTEQTGTGAEQSIAHGLGETPSLVMFFLTGDARAAWAVISIAEGTHDATNLKVTVTTDVKYRALAIA